MPVNGYEELIILNRKIDELIDRHSKLKSELEDLKRENGSLRRELQEKSEDIKELEKKYERVKLAGALQGGENGPEAKRKIAELVREIDRCVALLNR